MRILVTGGAGYVGSHVARHLVKEGHDVWIFDNLSTGHRSAALKALDACSERFIVGELVDQEKVYRTLADNDVEAVLHFAACALVGESVVAPAKYYSNNVVASLSLLDALRRAKVERMVLSSTCSIYGNADRPPLSEDTPACPINPYAFTKLAVEYALADYARAYGLGYAALRYFNAAGASSDSVLGEDHDPETHLIPFVLLAALARASVHVYGTDYPTHDGTCVRDYVHVEDLARAHLRALERIVPARGRVYNLGTGRGYSVREVIDAARRVTQQPIQVVEGPRREGDPPQLVACASRAEAELDWRACHTDIDAIIQDAWKWRCNFPQGYGD